MLSLQDRVPFFVEVNNNGAKVLSSIFSLWSSKIFTKKGEAKVRNQIPHFADGETEAYRSKMSSQIHSEVPRQVMKPQSCSHVKRSGCAASSKDRFIQSPWREWVIQISEPDWTPDVLDLISILNIWVCLGEKKFYPYSRQVCLKEHWKV